MPGVESPSHLLRVYGQWEVLRELRIKSSPAAAAAAAAFENLSFWKGGNLIPDRLRGISLFRLHEF